MEPTHQEDGERLTRAAAALRERLSEVFSKPQIARLAYHNAAHADDVAITVRTLAAAEGLDERRQILLETAGYLHDIGFLFRYAKNEPLGARFARRALPLFGYTREEAREVAQFIPATDLATIPTTTEEKLLRDADLANLGREDFHARNYALCREIGSLPDKEWYERSLRFLKSQEYLSAAGRYLLVPGKRQNEADLALILEHFDDEGRIVERRRAVNE